MLGRVFVLGALLLGSLLPAAARAQTDPPKVITPLEVVSDRNGVNLTTGLIKIDLPRLSIPAVPRLTFSRLQDVAPYLVGNMPAGDPDTTTYVFSAHLGASTSESFRCPAEICTSVNGSGSQLDYTTLTQAGTGAEYNFDVQSYDVTNANGRQYIYYASSIIYPGGEVISFNYQSFVDGARTFLRPTSVTSSLGYAISITYYTTGYTAGWSIPKDVTLYATASPTVALARFSYNSDATTITDIGGRVYSCTGCSNGLGNDVETWEGSLQLPGESSSAKTVTKISGNNYYSVVGAINQDGVNWSYAYVNLRPNSSNSAYSFDKISVTGSDGYADRYATANYDKRNFIISWTDRLNRVTSYQYDRLNRPTTVIYPEGNKTTVVYDDYGNVIQKTSIAKAGSGLANRVETAYVDTANCSGVNCYRVAWSRDALNRQTDYVYNAAGQLTEQTDPADPDNVRRKTYITYTTSGPSRPSVVRTCGDTSTCGTSAEMRTEYDYWNNTFLPSVKREIDAAAGVTLTTSYSYDAAGRLLSVDGPLAGSDDAVYYRYDILGRKTWEIGAKGQNGLRTTRRYTYRDSDDKVVSTEEGYVTDPNSTSLTVMARTDVSYDGRRNPTRMTTSASGTTYSVSDRSYDSRGQLTCDTQRMNPDAFGTVVDACTLGAQGGFGPDRIARNSYDAAGQLLKVEKAVNTSLAQDYATYTYSANGKRTSVKDANGNLASLRYDGFDRQDRWFFPSKTTPGSVSTTDYEAYGYDAVGNRTYWRKRDGREFSYTYDALNRMTSKIVPKGCAPLGGSCPPASATRDVYYNYDWRGLQLEARFDSATGADRVESAYDGFGRLIASNTRMSGTSRPLLYQYDASGDRTRITHPDGTYFTMIYDSADRMINATWWAAGTGTVPFVAIAYDGLGRRVDINRGSSYTGYNFQGGPWLGSMDQRFNEGYGGAAYGGWGYTHNPAGQITSVHRNNSSYMHTGYVSADRVYTVNGLNQYQTAGSVSFGYDPNGNLTSSADPSGTTSYVYDAENRLVSTTGPRPTTLVYDPLGRLWQTETANSYYGKSQYLYDGDHLVVEYDGDTGGLRRRFMWGPGADEPILQDEGGAMDCSGTRYFHTDHQGSVVAVADCWGNRLYTNTYDEYGIPGGANWGRFKYTGQAWLDDIGLYYYKARMYSPTLGRFLQTDPIGYDDQINLYAYVANDPVNKTDPTGMDSLWVTDASGNTVVMIPVRFTGAGATADAVGRIVARAAALDTGDSKLRIQIVPTDKPIGGVLNKMNYGPGYDFKHFKDVGEGVNKLGGSRGHINSDATDASGNPRDPEGAALHDVLHFAGYPDGYTGGEGDGKGGRSSSSPQAGLTDRNIMANRGGTSLTPGQSAAAASNRSSRTCTPVTGSLIPVCN